MIWQDAVNAGFELFGAIGVWMSVLAALRDKQIRGISMLAHFGFAAWGYWNLYYYPHLNQWLSFFATVVMVSGNTTHVALIWRYRKN